MVAALVAGERSVSPNSMGSVVDTAECLIAEVDRRVGMEPRPKAVP